MGKKEFAVTSLNPEYETYIVYIGLVSSVILPSSFPLKLNVYPSRRTQVSDLIAEKALIKVLDKYVNFADVFSLDLISKLPKHTRINDHAIKQVNSQ